MLKSKNTNLNSRKRTTYGLIIRSLRIVVSVLRSLSYWVWTRIL